jgi:hypothetical protein
MQQLSSCLAEAGVRKMVVSIDEEDDEAREVWDRYVCDYI